MAELFARYESGLQFTAGAIAGSANGVSGLNPIVDRINSVTQDDGVLSGTSLAIYASGGDVGNAAIQEVVAGEGINVTNGSLVSGEDSSAGNKGIVIVSPGEGIDVSYLNGTATVSAEDSTAANKGIVIVEGGDGIGVSYAAGTATINGEDSSASNKGIVIVSPGNGIDVNYSAGTATVSAETATTSNAGISELATSAEVTTGTDSSRTITPSALAGATIQSNVSGTDTTLYVSGGDIGNSIVHLDANTDAEAGAAASIGTKASTSISVNTGQNVLVLSDFGVTGNFNGNVTFQLRRDSTVIGSSRVGFNDNTSTTYDGKTSIHTIDTPGSGTFTYSIYIAGIQGSPNIESNRVSAIAI